MSDSIDDYLDQIDVTDTLRERVVEHQLAAARICPEEITEIFMSEYLTGDGQRQWTFLHFFSRHYAIEIANFISANQMDLVAYHAHVQVLELRRTEFDLETPTSASLLVAVAHLDHDYGIELSGSGINAGLLFNLARARFLPIPDLGTVDSARSPAMSAPPAPTLAASSTPSRKVRAPGKSSE